MSLRDVIRLETRSGAPVRAGGATITPQSQALVVSLPFGGLVWNRPVAVLVERDGQTERIPVLDMTRIALLALGGLAVAAAAVLALSASRRR